MYLHFTSVRANFINAEEMMLFPCRTVASGYLARGLGILDVPTVCVPVAIESYFVFLNKKKRERET